MCFSLSYFCVFFPIYLLIIPILLPVCFFFEYSPRCAYGVEFLVSILARPDLYHPFSPPISFVHRCFVVDSHLLNTDRFLSFKFFSPPSFDLPVLLRECRSPTTFWGGICFPPVTGPTIPMATSPLSPNMGQVGLSGRPIPFTDGTP